MSIIDQLTVIESPVDGLDVFLPNAEKIMQGGGHLMTTPEGIVMGIAGDEALRRFNLAELELGVPDAMWAQRGGTMYGDLFLVNPPASQPDSTLVEIVSQGSVFGEDRHRLSDTLRHEKVHAEQWFEWGVDGFITEYFRNNNPHDPCGHPMEIEAGLKGGGYQC